MHIDARVFLPVAALPQCELSVKVAQLLGLRGPWRRQVCRDMDCLLRRSYGPIRVFFRAFCSLVIRRPLWPVFLCSSAVQALRGLPCWRPSVVWHIRHIKGCPGWGPRLWFTASGIWWASLSVAKLPMLTCGRREAMVMAQPAMHASAVSSCFHGCLAFLHRHFPPQSPPSHPLDPSSCSQQQPSPWDCSTP